MTQKYLIQKEDLNIIEQTISQYTKNLNSTAIATLDSKNVYLWSNKKLDLSIKKSNLDNLYYFAHKTKILYRNFKECRACLTGIKKIDNQLLKYLGPFNKILDQDLMNLIFCPPLGAFLKEQKRKTKTIKFNPYNSKPSYQLSIIHEFGHINYLSNITKKPNYFINELYATLIEFEFSKKFLPIHSKNMKKHLIWLKENNLAENDSHFLPELIALNLQKFNLDIKKELLIL